MESFVSAGGLSYPPTEKQVPDIFLFDIMLPGMDGVQAVKILRENEHTKYADTYADSKIGRR